MSIKKKVGVAFFVLSISLFYFVSSGIGQEMQKASLAQPEASPDISREESPGAGTLAASPGNITVDFKDADINTVFRVLSLKSGVNIVPSDNVRGTVTMRLNDVPWDVALEVILRNYDYVYERVGNVITIGKAKLLTDQKRAEKDFYESQPFVMEVFDLKYLNAGDVAKVIWPMLSPKGSVGVLYRRGPKGWGYARLGLTKGETSEEDVRSANITTSTKKATPTQNVIWLTESGVNTQDIKLSDELMSKTLIITDIPPKLDKVRKIINRIDTIPKQVYIETRIVEVRRDKLRDIGVDLSTGTVESFKFNPYKKKGGNAISELGASSYTGQNVPQPFSPRSSGTDGINGQGDPLTGLFNTGLNLAYRKLTGFQFEVIIHALEEDVNANVLSAPRLRTLDNQEASILVGTKYPILKSDVTTATGGEATSVTSAELDYYQDIGIQLLVVPQINAEGYINMIVHPVVSNVIDYVSANIGTGVTPIQYPIMNVREAQTQILLQSGETVVIGGLLQDGKAKGREGIPILKDVPLLGLLFGRDTDNKTKIDLLIFITAYIEEDNLLVGRDKLRYEETQAVNRSYNKEVQKQAVIRNKQEKLAPR